MRGGVALLLLLPLAGCSVAALQPRGDGAAEIARLFWFFTAICAAVWVLVVAALLLSIRRRGPERDPLNVEMQGERRAVGVVGVCTAATVVVIAALTLLSYFTGKSLAGLGGPDELKVTITGQQWWWDIRYEDDTPSNIFSTANEIHIPTGRPVRLQLQSTDVIHSFWMPSITGKQDLIPGQQNGITIKAEKAGKYRGQCAEFCGLQHAHMALLLIAESPDEFQAWHAAQLKPALRPANPEQQLGQTVFDTRGCFMCHSIRGTPAGGRVGPDLTHIGSRSTIAAGTLPMSRGSLAAWIRNPQGIKPGSNMPEGDLAPDELNALVAYLTALK